MPKKFDAKEWAQGKRGYKRRNVIDSTPGCREALEAIHQSKLDGRSSATYKQINEEVLRDVFGINVSETVVSKYIRDRFQGSGNG